MRLTFPFFDGRSRNYAAVIDEDTGEEVGYIESSGSDPYRSAGMTVSLFDGKYRIDDADRYEECRGFVRGVEAVLNHMVHVRERPKPSDIESSLVRDGAFLFRQS